ncbi:molybdenum cofactor biosynthesis protein [Campylobacter troglodytis]|uniref:molybdenum cofactor biosynthesis protein n=1 Tax=Campylobacter troglodytis TaxID=654363 RepID=UPI001159C30A|nr:molybdenum cofactor biosynthesis protein [Campylobacter troglodytis]TQR60345.1 molybdenum cofactor biosynthesis protein [Campylobacter troglodytis]
MFNKKKKEPLKIPPKKIDPNDYILDDRLYGFTQKIREMAKDKDKLALLAKQLTRLIKADKDFKSR